MGVKYSLTGKHHRKLYWALALLLLSPLARSQDLSDELNALDDFPAEDMSEPSDDASSGDVANKPEESFDTPDDLNGLGNEGDLDKEFAAEGDTPSGTDLNTDVVEGPPPTEEQAPVDEPIVAPPAIAKKAPPAPAAPAKPAQPQQALTGVDSEPATVLTDLSFKQLPDRVRLIVKTEKPVDFAKETRGQRRQVIAELRNIKISNPLLKRALDTGEFAGPVAIVQAYESKSGPLPSVKILFQLRELVDPQITRVGNDLYVDFPIQTGDKGAFRTADSNNAPKLPETYLSLDGKETYKGTPISLNVKDADLADVLNFISKNTGKNFVIGSGVGSKVTLNVRNEPWDKVLAIILLNAKLGYQKLGDTYRIIPVSDLKTEITDAAKTAEESVKLVPLQTRLVPVNYAKADEVQVNVKDFLSTRGKVSIEKRTNSILISDLPEVIDKVVAYVRSIDKQTAQVQIEGRIVEATQSFSDSLTIDWNLGGLTKTKLKGSFANVGDTIKAASDGGAKPANSQGGGFRLRAGAFGPLSAIEALLTVAEVDDQARIIASPKITVLDNREASLNDGIRTQIPTSTADGIVLTQVEATLGIKVTPQVTSDGFVLMNVELTKDEPQGTTNFRIRRAKTEMLVESGKTAVVGGVYLIENSSSETGIPLLRSIPILGALFTSSISKTSNARELLMFISPTIINADRAFLSYRDASLQDKDKGLSVSRVSNNLGSSRKSGGAKAKPTSSGGDDFDLDSLDNGGGGGDTPGAKSSDDLNDVNMDDLPGDVL